MKGAELSDTLLETLTVTPAAVAAFSHQNMTEARHRLFHGSPLRFSIHILTTENNIVFYPVHPANTLAHQVLSHTLPVVLIYAQLVAAGIVYVCVCTSTDACVSH